MNVFQEAFYNAFKELKAFRVMVYIIWGIVIIGGIIVFGFNSNIEPVEFVPYSAKVELYYTEHFKRGGTYYQRIILKDKTSVTANAFSAVVDGRKTWLIDYIAVGDSLAHISWDTIYVYREGSKTYKFVYNIKDF